MPRSRRSSAISARARSCGSARTTSRWTSRPSPPARSGSTSRSASAACRAGGWSRSTGRNPPARPRSRCTAVAEAQKKGGICAFIDAEHALDPIYARKLGVNVDDLLISQPDTGEQALEIADTLVRSGAIDVLVIDSVAALVPRAELEGEMGDSQPGLQARLMSQALRKLTASINRSNTMVIFINQIRMKIGVMYGSPETTTGGNALKFYASVRLDIRRIGAIKERDEVVGNQTRVKVVKNKLAPPFKQVEFDIMYGEGISKMGELIDLGVKAGVVEKSGAWFSYDSQRIGQGRENAKAFLKANPDIAAKIEAAIRQNAGLIAEKILAGEEETATTRPRRRSVRIAASREVARPKARGGMQPGSLQVQSLWKRARSPSLLGPCSSPLRGASANDVAAECLIARSARGRRCARRRDHRRHRRVVAPAP